MPSATIASVRLTPESPVPGEAVLVEAIGTDGEAISGPDVSINGILGGRQYLQFDRPGAFRIVAAAEAEAEPVAVEIAVTAAPVTLAAGEDPRRFPLLMARRAVTDPSPYRLQMAAVDTPDFTSRLNHAYEDPARDRGQLDAALTIRSWTWDFDDGTALTTSAPEVEHDFAAALAPDEEHRLFHVRCTLTAEDGTTSSVQRTLSVVNAYAICRRLGVMALPIQSRSHARKVLGTFEATLQVRNPETSALTVTSRRFIWDEGEREHMSAWEDLPAPLTLAANTVTTVKIAVPFTTVPANVHAFSVVYLGQTDEQQIVHIEAMLDVPLPDQRTLGLRYGDLAFTRIAAVGLDRIQQELANPIVNPEPVQKRSIRVNERWGEVRLNPGGRRGLLTDAKKMATAGQQFAVLQEAGSFLQLVTEMPALQSILLDLPNGHVNPQALELKLPSWLGDLADMAKDLHVRPAGPEEGKTCDPENLPDAPEDWSCQMEVQPDQSPKMINWHYHHQYENARKGDLILAPGGPSGVIGGLLQQVGQFYGHMGIMTRNYDMITHCTFSEDRLLDEDNVVGEIDIPLLGSQKAPTEGFKPDVLKYGWPGTVTQWVSGAVETGKLAHPDIVADPSRAVPGAPEAEVDAIDPEGKPRPIIPFNKYASIDWVGGDWQVTPPLVVKPHPLQETADVRAALHQLADACRADTGKTHYRFYSYTDAARALTDTAPPEAGWAAGTYPAVCSSFIWAVARRLGLHLEGPDGTANPSDLEPSDIKKVKLKPGTVDGLYWYSAAERGKAADWLHNRIRTQVIDTLRGRVKDQIGDAGYLDEILAGVIDLFSDMSDDCANQFCNAFASDWCDTAAKDSDAWATPGEGVAVSPDDTMAWDGPDHDGLFGLAVPAVYKAAYTDTAPAYAWHFSPTKGTIHGTVRVDGQPRAGALVQVTDRPGGTTFTAADGTFRLEKVPFGSYEVRAQFDRGDGVLYNAKQPIDVRATDQTLDFDLRLRRDLFRLAHVSGDCYFMKYYVVGDNPRTNPPFPYEFSVPVTPDPTALEQRQPVNRDFHGIFGSAAFLLKWVSGGAIQWSVAWAVCQDANLADRAAWALSSAVDTVSLGFVSSLFGNEVKGWNTKSNVLQPGASVTDEIRIGPGDRSTGLLHFRIENNAL